MTFHEGKKEIFNHDVRINFSNTFERTYRRRKIIIISNMKGRGETSCRVTKNFWNGNHDVRSEMEKKTFFLTMKSKEMTSV